MQRDLHPPLDGPSLWQSIVVSDVRFLRMHDLYAGLFMPWLSVGAAWGRLTGLIVTSFAKSRGSSLPISLSAYTVSPASLRSNTCMILSAEADTSSVSPIEQLFRVSFCLQCLPTRLKLAQVISARSSTLHDWPCRRPYTCNQQQHLSSCTLYTVTQSTSCQKSRRQASPARHI